MVEDIWGLNIHKSQWATGKIGLHNTVLDVGCGDSGAWYVKGLWRMTTLDKEVREEPEPCHPDIIGDAQALPLEDKTFDIVCLMEILEHLEKPGTAIKEALRVARQKVIMTVPWEERWPDNLKPFTNPGHRTNYTPDLFDNLLKQFGNVYQIQLLFYEGWAWIGGEIYK